MTRLSQLWWTQFHGPAQFLEEFCRSAAQGGCFFLRHTEVIPWYYQFQELVLEGLQREVGHFRQEELAEVPENASPQWFVERFLPQHASNFLSTTRLADFLTQTGGLRRRVLWLRTDHPETLQVWLERLSQFAVTSAAKETILILEGRSPLPTRRKVKLFDVDEAFTPFDSVQLCTIAANEVSCQGLLKPYLTHLLDQLCGTDPGAVELLLEQGEALVRDPQAGAACLDLDRDTVDRRVRRAQLICLLPLAEDIRVYLLEQLKGQCQALLPFDEIVNGYKNEYHEVFELEPRHLHNFLKWKQIEMTSEQETLTEAAWDVGNKLRHQMDPLPFSMVENLLRLAGGIDR